MQSMDRLRYRRFLISFRRNLRLIRGSFRRHGRRNFLSLLIGFFFCLWILSCIGQYYNSVEARWLRLQAFVQPGVLGGAPDFATKEDRLAKIKVRLCSVDGKLCSDWSPNQIWEAKDLNRDESWLVPGRIEVPIGVKAVLQMKNGGQLVLPYGRHDCSSQRLHCHDISTMVVEGNGGEWSICES